MKIRNGFVSNSSSSSFLIYGITLDSDEILKIFNVPETDGDDDYSDDVWELLEEKLANTDLEYFNPYYEDGSYYIGKSWDSVKDDETGKQFKDSIEKELTELFGDNLEFGTLEEAWRDG